MSENIIQNNKKYIIFRSAGRTGNAIFRYFASILYCLKYNYEFILETEYDKLNNEYTFYPGVDQPGNDIEHMYNIFLDKVINTKYSRGNEYYNNIKGFNTFGFLKSKINIDELRENNCINSNTHHGIFVKNENFEDNTKIHQKIFTINDNNFFDFLLYENVPEDHHILMDGYFQFNDIYLEKKDEIIKYINKNNHYLDNDNKERFLIHNYIKDIPLPFNKIYDLVIHIRLGDFNDREDFIELKYLKELFENIKINDSKIGIVSEKANSENDIKYINDLMVFLNDKYININNNNTIVLESNDIITDFNIMKQCKNIICSNSTLSWIATYLSKSINNCIFPNYCIYKIDRKLTFKNPIKNTIYYNISELNNLNIKVIILTLKDNDKRKRKFYEIISIFRQLGINLELFYGINGEKIKIIDTEDNNIKLLYNNFQTIYYNKQGRINMKDMNLGELGCSWSQINIYKKLLKDKIYDKYLVLEDDAIFESNLENLMNILINIPEDIDIGHLGKSECFNFKLKDKINDYYYSIEKEFFNRTTSYIISKNGAKKLLEYVNNIITRPADDLLSNYFIKNDNFNVYVPKKYLFTQHDNDSIINDI